MVVSMKDAIRLSKPFSHTSLALVFGATLVVGCAASQKKEVASPPAQAPAEPGEAEQPVAHADPHQQGHHGRHGPFTNEDWWPNRLDLRVLKATSPQGDPTDADFDYRKEFEKLDLVAVKKDIENVLTTSQAWWPADWGHYGGLMIRLAWHSAGTYRVHDGRGGSADGTIRFAPLNSWPDNANLDKARRLLWPVKKKYGKSLSWGDLLVLSGNVALESMGFKTLGFGGGREDVFEPTDINWGPETEWLSDKRFSKGELDEGLGATEMGLIYVNPEGPGGKPDPMAAAQHIRTAFGRMAMNDEETVALIAGGHTLGKAHGAHKPGECVGPVPEEAPVEEQGLGWKNKCGTGKGKDTITSGLEGAWTMTPTKWSHDFFSNLFSYEWELIEGPGGKKQWQPKGDVARVPDAHDPTKSHKPMMLTTDLALVTDPAYHAISKRFYEKPDEFEKAFARAWFKLTHRDMGPHARLVGSEVPDPQLWQDPVPKVDHPLVTEADVARLKKEILASGLTTAQLVSTAWAAASSYRDTDMRGGANGGRLRLAPQKDWAVNEPAELAKVLTALEKIQTKFNDAQAKRKISMADLIVLGGAAAIEDAAKKAGATLVVPFTPGRTDASAEMTDVESFAALEPTADGFRNYVGTKSERTPAELLIDKADFLGLTAPEMSVLLAGMRVLGANHGGSKHGVLTDRPGTLSNDFFLNLIDSQVSWRKANQGDDLYEAVDAEGKVVWTGTSVDLVMGSNSQLRAIAEVYAADDAKQKFSNDFVAAWVKVMTLDRFDLQK